jgi:ATP-binding protein involved in chromosome partitioning
VEWGKLDYLIVDLPPGTGDIQLSLCQKIPLTGAVIVSTPQDLAFKVAEKAIVMFKKLHTPVLGLVENMSGFVCGQCGHEDDIFGKGGAERYSKEHHIPFLGSIPLSSEVCQKSDEGKPIVESLSGSPAALAFKKIAENLVKLAQNQNQINAALADLEPVEMSQPSQTEVRIVWKDSRESLYAARSLRFYCSCAQCVDEVTGVRRVREEMIPQGISIISTRPVGRYGLQFQYSDGHSTGIYTYEYLRSLDTALAQSGSEGRRPK